MTSRRCNPDATLPADAAPTSGSASVSGTINGVPFVALDAVSAVVFTPAGTQAGIFITSTPDFCADLAAKVDRADSAQLFFVAAIRDANDRNSTPTAPASFPITSTPIPPGEFSFGGYLARDATCQLTTPARATAGSVVVADIDNQIFDGTFDVTLASGDRITGTFSPGACPIVNANATGFACQ